MAGTFSNLTVHVVFSTKDRLPLMTIPIRDKLFPYMGGIVRGLGGTIITVGGMPDHIHLVARLVTTVSVADVARTVKANSSKWMNEKFTTMKFGWQRGYGAFSISHSALPAVVNYVRNQERHHRHRSFREELMDLLAKNGIDYDERHRC